VNGNEVLATAADLLSAVLMLTGSVFALIAAVGLHRMPDTFRRFHVATKPATLAIACTFSGAALQLPLLSDAAKLLVALVLQFVTAPVAAHLLGRAQLLREERNLPADELPEDA